MNETKRKRLIVMLDELENAGIEYGNFYDHPVLDHGRIDEARRRLIGLFESLEPKEEP